MNIESVPWLDLAILAALVGSPIVSLLRNPRRAYQWALAFTGMAFACSVVGMLNYYAAGSAPARGLQPRIFGSTPFRLDDLSAPLVPTVALLHLVTALATSRAHKRRFSFSWSLAAEAIRLATFSCRDPWTIVGLLVLAVIPPYIELVNRGRNPRVYLAHMAVFVVLLVLGQLAVGLTTAGGTRPAPWWAVLPLLFAILICCANVPAHCWLTDWFEHASLGIALLYVVPLGGLYAVVRLLLPIAPGWILQGIGLMSLATAFYAAAMATVQRDVRRFFAYLLLCRASLVLVGLGIHSDLSLTAALSMWLSAIVSLGGFGLMLRALEARLGRLSLAEYHGLYDHSPTLAVCFLVTGLAGVGFPGTLGFISTDMLIDSCVERNPLIGIAVVAAAALNGIAVVRAYFLIFTGTRHVSTVSLALGLRERVAVLSLTAILLVGGFFPQPGIRSQLRAAGEILDSRRLAGSDRPPRGW